MSNNIEVAVVADVTNLATQFGIARAESQNLTREFQALARQANDMGPQTADFQQKLQAAAESMVQAKTKAADLNAQLKEASGGTQAFGASLGEANALLGQFGAALSVAAAVNFGKSSLEYAADIEHMANVLGLSTDDLQAFQFAARDSGVEVDDADTLLRRFMSNLGGLREGTGPAVKAIEDLGISAKELDGPPTDAIALIAKRLMDIQDPAERARIETELFGRAGLDVNAMLEKLAQGFDDMREKASAAGQMLGGDVTKDAEKAENAIAGLWAALKGATAQFLDFAIVQNPFIDEMTRTAEAAKKMKESLPATAGGLGNEFQKPDLQAPDIEGMQEAYRKQEEASKHAAEEAKRAAAEIEKAYEDEVSASLADAQRQLDGMARADVQGVNDYIEESNRKLSAAISELDKEYQAHEITAEQKRDAEVSLTEATKTEVLKRLDAEIAALQVEAKGNEQLTALLNAEIKKRTDLIIQWAKQEETANDQYVKEFEQKWQSAVAPFNSAFQQMLSGTSSFAQIGLSLLDSFIMKIVEGAEKDAVAWIATERVKTSATEAGNAARTASNLGSSAVSTAADLADSKKSIMGDAADSAASAFKWVMREVPFPINIPLAALSAAGVFAAVEAFGGELPSLDIGTNYVPRDMLAMVHRGEAVVPARYNTNNGGDVHNWSFSPNVHGVPMPDIMDHLYRHQAEFVSFINRLSRNGSLRIVR